MRTTAITGIDPGQNTLLSYSYGYDKMDNIKTRNTQDGNYAYNYDDLYRLNNVQKDANQTESYTYDQVGNRLTSITATDWTFNANNELQSYYGVTYQYDANGNTTQKNNNGQIQNYIYSVDNRLVEVQDASGNSIARYTYDPFGRRISKTVGGTTTYFLYSDEGLIGEYDSAGNEIVTYGYKPNSTWSTDPLFMKQGTNYYFYHNDHLGTPKMLTDISGAVVWSATYDAFGKATVDAGSTVVNNLRFPGQYYDAETGLHYNWNRYYEPTTGRYVTTDPIGFEGEDENIYRYVWNDSINWYDEDGLKGRGGGKGERGRTARPDGSGNEYKHYRPDPKNPSKVRYTDPHTGTESTKTKPDGFDDYWNNKHPKKCEDTNPSPQNDPPFRVPPPPKELPSLLPLLLIPFLAFG